MDRGAIQNMICNICDTKMPHFVEDLYRCPNCDLISSRIPPDLSRYDREYATRYQAYDGTEISRQLIELRANLILSKMQEGEFLDFGCGTGALIRHLTKKSNLSVSGWDLSPFFCYDNRLVMRSEKFAGVSFWDSLEHLWNPRKVIESLSPKHIFIGVPSLDDICVDQILDWRHYKPGEHIHYFSEWSLICLLVSCGYSNMKYHYKESKIRASGGDKNILTVYAQRLEN